MKRALRTKVLLVDDSRIVRERLLALISELPEVEVIGQATNVAEAIKKILGAVEIEADSARIEKLVSELKGKNIQDVIKAGQEKLSSLGPIGGGSSAPVSHAPETKKDDKKPEEKKPKVEEKKEESDGDMGLGLFD